MKKHELDMAQFLEALKAPQSRRIIEKLALKDLSLRDLMKATKLSEQSIKLNVQPLIKANVVKKTRTGLWKINRVKFRQHSEWFASVAEAE